MAQRFLALGDSYTIGEGADAGERWPVQLVGLLRDRGIDAAAPEIVAKTGWTTADLATALGATQVTGPFDVVSLLIGVNDQYDGVGLEAYRERFSALLALAVALAEGEASKVLVLSVPDWGATPFAADRDRRAIAAEIDAFNAVNRAAARRARARYVDVTTLSRRHGADAAWLAADRLHYSGTMYRAWAELAVAAVMSAG